MKCPYKDCGFEVPDGETFCDECGRDFAICSGCNTANILANKFCLKCGVEIVNDAPAAAMQPAAAPQPTAQPQPQPQAMPMPVPPPQTGATEFMGATGGRLFFRSLDGWDLELADGDILGRNTGRHTDRLGTVKVISGTHAKITKAQDGWYITDQKSLNKTFVNGQEAIPFQPQKIQNNDVVTLANVKFTVTEI